ncbi:sodium:solute symporter family protein [Alkalibacter mobilis]|uniref:sodium:solute symporter family protein n=1 Tax=Alkalibacter mobilis TaxID=2787712 RepID=UPI00189F2565|nr:sodium:solute symporter family protein [Alkalibacter mobilis]MBF7096746.1 sodium:solute symporter family protein [Alkalibacter mobilis]
MYEFSWIPFIMMGGLMVAVLGLSYKATISKRLLGRSETFEDFYTGNKSFATFTVALVTLVTFYSGSTFTGRVGYTFSNGVAALSVIPSCAMAGVIMYFLAEKVWPLAKKYRLSTLADLLELRYQNRYVKAIVATTIVSFNIIWLILEIRTLGYIINIVSGGLISDTIGSLIGFSVIVMYVVTGGVKSVASVDSFTSLVVLTFSFATLLFILGSFYNGSITNIFEVIRDVAPEKMVFETSGEWGWKFWLSIMIIDTPTGFIYPANFMMICMGKDTKTIKKSAMFTALSGSWLALVVVLGFAAYGITTMGYTIVNPESSLLEMVTLLSSPFFVGVVATFIFAAALGTLDSTLIGLSGLISNDIIGGIKQIRTKEPLIGSVEGNGKAINERVTKNSKQEIRRTRIAIVTLGAVAFLLSLYDLPVMMLMIALASGGLIQVAPIIVGGLWWKKSTPVAGLAGMGIGLTTYIIFHLSGLDLGGLYVSVPAIILNIIVYVSVSLLTYKKHHADHPQMEKILKDFFDLKSVEKYIEEEFVDL